MSFSTTKLGVLSLSSQKFCLPVIHFSESHTVHVGIAACRGLPSRRRAKPPNQTASRRPVCVRGRGCRPARQASCVVEDLLQARGERVALLGDARTVKRGIDACIFAKGKFHFQPRRLNHDGVATTETVDFLSTLWKLFSRRSPGPCRSEGGSIAKHNRHSFGTNRILIPHYL